MFQPVFQKVSVDHSPSCRFIVISLHILYHTGQHFYQILGHFSGSNNLYQFLFFGYTSFSDDFQRKNCFMKIIIKNELVSMLCQRKVLFIMEGAKEDYYY